jgi:S-DNA-T family DNA segregation ATPase FtsK/SpoIIIE
MAKKRKDTTEKEESRGRRYLSDSSASEPPAEQLPLPWVRRGQKFLVWLLELARGVANHREIVAAVGLFAFAAFTLFCLLDWTNGILAVLWGNVLWSWLGWGALVVPLTAVAAGAAALAPVWRKRVIMHWPRVVVGEIAVACGLGVLQLFYQRFAGLTLNETIAAAAAGEAGGIFGWSLVWLFDNWFKAWGGPLLGVCFALCAAFAAGITPAVVFRWLLQWQAQLRGEAWAGDSETVSTTVITAPTGKADAARTLKLDNRPREKIKYTKRFTVEQQKEIKPAKSKKRDARLPPLDFLEDGGVTKISESDLNRNATIIERTLGEFGIPATVRDLKTGPSVTQYLVEPGYVERPGPDGQPKKYKVRVSQISTLANDLALALSASTIRIEAPVPGTNFVGIEVPNRKTTNVGLRGVMESEGFAKLSSPLAIALGRDVSGTPLSADLAKMPHLLIAGTTGSGKSVCITSIITGLVMNNTPDDLRLVMIDPKMVELVRFNGLPHLYGKVEVELERIVGTLRWMMREMDRRYKLFESLQARDITNYNHKLKKGGERLPRVVVLIDELADLMLLAPDETEKTLVRLAQMARATGLHLVVATQRPSTDIVTGLIKANFPARISFAVASGIDSRGPSRGWGAATCSSSRRRRKARCVCKAVLWVTARWRRW